MTVYLTGEVTPDSPAVNTHRRYELLKARRMRDWLYPMLKGAFYTKQNEAWGVSFPDTFPDLVRLRAARYFLIEDLWGADIDEVVVETSLALAPKPGLTRREAAAVLNALAAIIQSRGTVGYQIQSGPFKGTYANTREADLQASKVLGSGNTPQDGVEFGDRGTIRARITVTAVSGTSPTLDGYLETSRDNGVNDSWRQIKTITQMLTTGVQYVSVGGADRFVRFNPTIGGSATPTVTCSVAAEAV